MFKKYYMSSPLLISFFVISAAMLTSCSSEDSDAHFFQTYEEILLLREQFPDTTECNPKVRSILAGKGYSEATFSREFLDKAAKGEKFIKKLDSLRFTIREKAQPPRDTTTAVP